MNMVYDLLAGAAFAGERQETQSEHIKRGEAGSEESNGPHNPVLSKRVGEYFIFGEESRERRQAGDRQCCNEKLYKGDGKIFSESSHVADILFATHAVDHASRAE